MTLQEKYPLGGKVDLVILRETDLGFVARINNEDEGLLYHNEIFEHLEPNQELPGYVKAIRVDGSIDLILHPFGHLGAEELGERILEMLKENNGFLAVTNKSEAQLIYDMFGVSKKKYKIAIGGLYKKRLITFTDDGVSLINSKN